MPYATPPVATNRFSPTRAPSPWNGVRLSDKLSPVCPQKLPDIANETAALERMPKGRVDYLKRLLPYLRNQSEDCLYLNIYAPAQGQLHISFIIVQFSKGGISFEPFLPLILCLGSDFRDVDQFSCSVGRPHCGKQMPAMYRFSGRRVAGKFGNRNKQSRPKRDLFGRLCPDWPGSPSRCRHRDVDSRSICVCASAQRRAGIEFMHAGKRFVARACYVRNVFTVPRRARFLPTETRWMYIGAIYVFGDSDTTTIFKWKFASSVLPDDLDVCLWNLHS